VSLPSSYQSRRGHIHLLRVLPVVGCRSKTPTAMTRFHGCLHREIQEILDNKEYADMTTIFEYACQAEREVQRRRSKNIF
jgi:hypothetical protein